MSYWTYVGMTAVMLVVACVLVAIIAFLVNCLPLWIVIAILALAFLFLMPLLMMQGDKGK